ncbi:hypothetical protein [Streptomyces fradiae]|uniref:hypothetical protein n=1 Tax=Streptomyces fradiae TaxID=1906 RepID=UPI003510FCAF
MSAHTPPRAVSRWQKLAWSATVPVGLAGAFAASALAARARAYCDAAWEPPHRLVHLVEFVVLSGVTVAAALGAAVLARRLSLRASRPARASAQLVAVLTVVLLLSWAYLAVQGTPAGYPGDSGLCPASNVPPWWPAWVPV